MRILVTGGSGFIGTNYIDLLLRRGKEEFINLDFKEKVDRKTMYVADDQPADLYDMANMIQKAVGARNIFHVPLWMAKLAARIGDGCKAAGWHSVPLSSFRLNNIRTEYVFDMQPIMEVSGPLPYSLKTGVEQTIEWLREMGKI